MVKGLNAFEMKKQLNNTQDKLYVRNFNGATTKAMHHHAVPVMEFNPDLVILHVGTNSLRGSDTDAKIADDIVTLAKELKTNNNEIIISSIIERRDELKDKAKRVNDFLVMRSAQFKIPLIRHDHINENHLKPKGLHLSTKGSELLSENFIGWINA